MKKRYCEHESMIFLMLKRWNFLISDFYFPGGQRRPPPTSPVLGVVVVVIPRMALIWLMTRSLIIPIKRSPRESGTPDSPDSPDSLESNRSSNRPLSTLSPASVSSAGTGLAKAREQRRKQTRRVLIIFSGGQEDWGETAGSSFISRLCPQLPPWQASHLSQMIVMLTASWHRNLEILTNKLEKYFFFIWTFVWLCLWQVSPLSTELSIVKWEYFLIIICLWSCYK